LVRAALASIVGLDAATLGVAGLVAGLLIWPASRRWLVGRAWCAVVRRRLIGCLRVTRAGTRRGGDLPVVVRTRPTLVGERVTLWCRIGQSAEQIGARIAEMRSAAWCQEIRVTRDPRRAHLVYVEVIRRDTLARVVPALPVPDSVDLTAVPVGRTERGGLWLLRLLGTHLLIAGVTGAGKGSVVWLLLRGIAPAIRSGLVQVWAVDPKGGMELGLGGPLFTRFAHREYADMVRLLEDAVGVMRERATRLAGVVRLHTPTVEEPLIVVLVDEVANLTAYLSDRDLRRRAEGALALLLTQGRAVGVSVVACLQDPRKEVLGMRNLFPTKVALRLDEPSQVDMVLGDGARDRGALADSIPDTAPGVGYAREDGSTAVVRVRAGYVTDPDITAMAERYAAPIDRPFSTVGGEAA
jgi:S-DNA-T family DNA segregation ATPase FtsK/SpoIIIE